MKSSLFSSRNTLARGLRVIILTALLPCLFGCASQKMVQKNPNDPLESVNRPIFAVNRALDKVFVRPLAVAYTFATPKPIRAGVSNFFANIDDITITINKVLQGEMNNAMKVSGRFLMNSTLGLAGTFDVASRVGLNKQRADFGMTMASWGYKESTYIVLPLFGPSTVRDGTGLLVDFLMSPYPYIPEDIGYYVFMVDLLNIRANLLEDEFYFDYAAQDPYTFMRDVYMQHRRSQLGLSNVDQTADAQWNEENLDDWKTPTPAKQGS